VNTKICCKNCRRIIEKPNRKIKNQKYCNRKVCQRARKRKWQRNKMQTDEDYRRNQKESRDKWLENHPDYYKHYRDTHIAYTDRNREMQKDRDAARRLTNLANMDALMEIKYENTERYFIVSADGDLAKMDALIPVFHIIPVGYTRQIASCKKGLNRQDDSISVSCEKQETKNDDSSDLSRSSPQN